MPTRSTLATYLPCWSASPGHRRAGSDEDAVTMAVAAGRHALAGVGAPRRVVIVTRAPALLEGGSGAVLAAGLGLPSDTEVIEQLGGAAAALDACIGADPATLVVGVDPDTPAGAGALWIGEAGSPLRLAARVQRSLPTRTRDRDGHVVDDDDARLRRERAVRAALDAAALADKPTVLAGLTRRDAAPFCAGDALELATLGASSALLALAAMAERSETGPIGAFDQAVFVAACLDPSAVDVRRLEPAARPWPTSRASADATIAVALTAYDRAFEAKLRWQAGRCRQCGLLALPPRHRCLGCGAEGNHDLVPLPRTAEVYTATTVHVPVPGLATPYTLAVVELVGVGVRALVTVTDSNPGDVEIGDRGRLVLRRVAVRSGVPDYGYALAPEGP